MQILAYIAIGLGVVKMITSFITYSIGERTNSDRAEIISILWFILAVLLYKA